MRRRALLANATALGALTTLAGCLNTGGGDEATTQETTTTETSTTTEPTTRETTTTRTTTVAPLELQSKQIRTQATACGTENTGSIEFTDSGATIAISGSVPTNTPCYEARYVSHRLLGDVVQLTVGAGATDADACQSCLGHVEYTGTVETNRTPHSVVLVHKYTPEDKDEPVTEVVADKGSDE